jgi:hypothetical protein
LQPAFSDATLALTHHVRTAFSLPLDLLASAAHRLLLVD